MLKQKKHAHTFVTSDTVHVHGRGHAMVLQAHRQAEEVKKMAAKATVLQASTTKA